MNNYKKYIRNYSLIFLISLMPVGVSFLFLWRAGELNSPQAAYETQKESGRYCPYSSMLFNTYDEYKTHAFADIKPEIISIGSSTSTLFRQTHFEKSFYNYAYTIKSTHNIKSKMENLLKKHKPKVMIVGIDFWWFNEEYHQKARFDTSPEEDRKFQFGYLKKPLKMLRKGYMSTEQFFDILIYGEIEGICGVGYSSKTKNSGFGIDGSTYYVSSITGGVEHADIKFQDSLSRIENSKHQFRHASDYSEKALQNFFEFTDYLESQDIKVIYFMPPLPQQIIDKMQEYDYSYIPKLKAELAKKIKFYDLNNPNLLLKTNDCEFYDGFHAGEILNLKILDYLARKENLRGYVDRKSIRKIIRDNKGLSMVHDANITDLKELDFLEIGCEKGNRGNRFTN